MSNELENTPLTPINCKKIELGAKIEQKMIKIGIRNLRTHITFLKITVK